jgi:hypothetical protein
VTGTAKLLWFSSYERKLGSLRAVKATRGSDIRADLPVSFQPLAIIAAL